MNNPGRLVRSTWPLITTNSHLDIVGRFVRLLNRCKCIGVTEGVWRPRLFTIYPIRQ